MIIYDIALIEVVLLLVFIFIQSIFGIGLLVFGTPTLFFLGYSYPHILSILLPLSILVSFIQIVGFKQFKIDNNIKNFIKITIPTLIIFLSFALYNLTSDNFYTLFSIFMILIASQSFLKNKLKIKYLKKNIPVKLFLFFLGCIHGLTNMGGGFLSLLSLKLYENNKLLIKKFIVYCYFFFGVIQIIILLFYKNFALYKDTVYLLLIIPFIHYLSEIFFKKIDFNFFHKIINLIILFYGIIILVTKNI